jgi:glutamate/tyrosine decarboxylase-like PLP-dependent enzyme
MEAVLKNDLRELEEVLGNVKDTGVVFLKNLNDWPNDASGQEVVSSTLPENGLGTAGSLAFFQKHYEKLMVASPGPRYWGFVTGGATPAGIAGDWLTAVYDQNTQTTDGSGDVSAAIEKETIRLLCDLVQLPQDFNGGFVTGATMSNFTGLAVGRQWAGEQAGKDISRDGMTNDIVVLGATPHSSVVKSLSMLGFGSNNLVKIKTLSGREAIDIQDLEEKLIHFEGKAVILNCSAGTVNTVDFDDIQEIVALKKKYNFWLHIDAAFGGFAAASPAHRHLLNGWEQADSITIDCHKWLNVPYDSAVILVRKEHDRLQIKTFQNTNAPYLGDPSENFSYLNFLPENSRRFRALPAWFSLTAYGRNGFQWIVENSIAMANELANCISESAFLELNAPIRLNVVCFKLKDDSGKTAAFLNLINKRGKVFMTPTTFNGNVCIRAAFVNFRTSKEDIQIAMREMEETYRTL